MFLKAPYDPRRKIRFRTLLYSLATADGNRLRGREPALLPPRLYIITPFSKLQRPGVPSLFPNGFVPWFLVQKPLKNCFFELGLGSRAELEGEKTRPKIGGVGNVPPPTDGSFFLF